MNDMKLLAVLTPPSIYHYLWVQMVHFWRWNKTFAQFTLQVFPCLSRLPPWKMCLRIFTDACLSRKSIQKSLYHLPMELPLPLLFLSQVMTWPVLRIYLYLLGISPWIFHLLGRIWIFIQWNPLTPTPMSSPRFPRGALIHYKWWLHFLLMLNVLFLLFS